MSTSQSSQPTSPTSPAHEAFVTTEDVAQFLNKPRTWVFNNGHTMPRYRVGNHYRYLLSEVAAWVKAKA